MVVYLGTRIPDFRPCVTNYGDFVSFHQYLNWRERTQKEQKDQNDQKDSEINFYVLTTHPKAFTCVCSSELMQYHEHADKFAERKSHVIVLEFRLSLSLY